MVTPATDSPSLDRLTDIQRQLARFVHRFILDNRYAPSVQECADSLRVEASAAADHLGRLVKKGVLGRKPRVSRALWVEDAWKALLDGPPDRERDPGLS